MPDNTSTVKLIPFALTHDNVETIHVAVESIEFNLLRITYLVKGDIEKLKIPERPSARQAERLWEHTCFEAFIGSSGNPSYNEFNFAPSGQWAAYSFRGYRDGGPIDGAGWLPEIDVRRGPDRFELDAVVPLHRLPAIQSASTLRIGLSAVVEANDRTLYYWALKHPAAKPDFHHPDSFVLELAFPGQGA